MKLWSPNKARWLGGFAVGVLAGHTIREGWGALAMLACGILGQYVVRKLAGYLFDDEIDAAKKHFLKDPVKLSIWQHASNQHAGKWQDCYQPDCLI